MLISFHYSFIGIGVHLPRAEHTGVQVDMTMIAMKVVNMITGMAMGGKENMDIEMMTDTVVLEIRPTGKEIVILGILMNATRKMNTEEVIATLNMQKDRVAGATATRRLIHRGLFNHLFRPKILLCYS